MTTSTAQDLPLPENIEFWLTRLAAAAKTGRRSWQHDQALRGLRAAIYLAATPKKPTASDAEADRAYHAYIAAAVAAAAAKDARAADDAYIAACRAAAKLKTPTKPQ